MSMSDTLALIAGALLSVICAYVPGLADKFKALDPIMKRVVMLVLLVVAAGAIAGLSCAPMLAGLLPPEWAITCDQPGIVAFVRALILAIGANQGAFGLLPASSASKAPAMSVDMPAA